jgi:hypothetical protein
MARKQRTNKETKELFHDSSGQTDQDYTTPPLFYSLLPLILPPFSLSLSLFFLPPHLEIAIKLNFWYK